MMDRAEVKRRWCRYLSEALPSNERMEMLRALEADAALRQELLKDAGMDWLLRELANKGRTCSGSLSDLDD